MFLPAPEGGDFTPVPAGTHLAVCYRVIDLGTQEGEYMGKPKIQHKILLSWELPQERRDDEKPFTVNRRYTWSMSEKSALRKHLEAWRGKTFEPQDFGPPNGFNIKKILGTGCLLTIVHEDKKDKTYSNIDGVGKLMKGMTAPIPENEMIYLWIDPEVWNAATFNALPEGIQNTIRKSPEYAALLRARDGERVLEHADGGDNYDDIPF